MPDLAVSLSGAVCLRSGQPVLRGISLAVPRGRALLVTGANGAGKSTLLRAIAGLLPLAAGQGSVLGHDLVRARTAVRRSVAFLAHDSFGYDELTVRGNLRFHGALAGASPSAIEHALAKLGLSELANQLHGQLSAGQQRRSALAMALLQRRPLLLLDEPHAALDAQGRALVNATLAEAIDAGVTIIVVTHEPELVRELVHEEVELLEGQCYVTTSLSK